MESIINPQKRGALPREPLLAIRKIQKNCFTILKFNLKITGSVLMQSEKTEALSVTLPVELTRLIKIFITKWHI